MRVAAGTDEEGYPVFADGRLVAVLVRLSELHEKAAGHWFLGAGFGRVDGGPDHPTFANLDEAEDWIQQRLA